MKCKKCGQEYEGNTCSKCGFNEKKYNKTVKYSIITGGFISIMALLTIIYNLTKPKPDYDKFNATVETYISTIDYITDIKFVDEGMYSVTVDDRWFNTSEINKVKFCDNVRNILTSYGWECNIISDNELIWVVFNDKDGTRLAEPNGSVGQYKILY